MGSCHANCEEVEIQHENEENYDMPFNIRVCSKNIFEFENNSIVLLITIKFAHEPHRNIHIQRLIRM